MIELELRQHQVVDMHHFYFLFLVTYHILRILTSPYYIALILYLVRYHQSHRRFIENIYIVGDELNIYNL